MSDFDEDKQFGSDGDEVEVFHRVNKLKLKAGGDLHGTGTGKLSKERVKRAQMVVESYAQKYPKEVGFVLVKLDEAWADIQSKDEQVALDGKENLYHAANQLKDLSSVCNSPLMQHFGLSLRKFTEESNIQSPEHKIIIKAHIDVIKVAYQTNLKDDDNEKAEELKLIVAKAIEKYH